MAPFYLRFVVRDGLGVVLRIAEACVEAGVSIDKVMQIPMDELGPDARDRCPFVVMTDRTTWDNAKAVCEQVATADFNVEAPFFMPVLEE